MNRLIFTCLLSFTVSIFSANAQLLRFNKKADPHFRFSDYEPKKDKKEEKKLKKKQQELAASSYHPAKSSYFDRKEYREAEMNKKRMKRAKENKLLQKEKGAKIKQKDFQKKDKEKKQLRSKKVKENKKNYGTAASRKQFRTFGSNQYSFMRIYDRERPTKNGGKGKYKAHKKGKDMNNAGLAFLHR